MLNFHPTITIGDIIFAITAIVAIYEFHRSRRKDFYEIDHNNRERYFEILDNRRDIEHYYDDPHFDLEELQSTSKEDYKKIIASEKEYFRFIHDCWKAGHIHKSIPRYLRQEWDQGPQAGMQNPVHFQAWQKVIKDLAFVEKDSFTKFIAKCIEKGKNRELPRMV